MNVNGIFLTCFLQWCHYDYILTTPLLKDSDVNGLQIYTLVLVHTVKNPNVLNELLFIQRHVNNSIYGTL